MGARERKRGVYDAISLPHSHIVRHHQSGLVARSIACCSSISLSRSHNPQLLRECRSRVVRTIAQAPTPALDAEHSALKAAAQGQTARRTAPARQIVFACIARICASNELEKPRSSGRSSVSTSHGHRHPTGPSIAETTARHRRAASKHGQTRPRCQQSLKSPAGRAHGRRSPARITQ